MLHPRRITILLMPASVLRVAVDGVDRMATASCVKRGYWVQRLRLWCSRRVDGLVLCCVDYHTILAV